MDFVRSYFGTNEPLTIWTLFSSLFDWLAVHTEQTSQKVRKKVFNWSEVDLYRSNFLQNPYFKYLIQLFDSGLVNSRLEREWCLNVSRCIDPAFICEDMELDFMTANKLIQERRNQILYGAIFRCNQGVYKTTFFFSESWGMKNLLWTFGNRLTFFMIS